MADDATRPPDQRHHHAAQGRRHEALARAAKKAAAHRAARTTAQAHDRAGHARDRSAAARAAHAAATTRRRARGAARRRPRRRRRRERRPDLVGAALTARDNVVGRRRAAAPARETPSGARRPSAQLETDLSSSSAAAPPPATASSARSSKTRTRVERELRQRRSRAQRRQAQPHAASATRVKPQRAGRSADLASARVGQRRRRPALADGHRGRRGPASASPRLALAPPAAERSRGQAAGLIPAGSAAPLLPHRRAAFGRPSSFGRRAGSCYNAEHAYHDQIRKALEAVIDPELRRNIVELDMVRSIEIHEGGVVDVMVSLTTPGCPIRNHFQTAVANAVGALDGVTAVNVDFDVLTDQQKAGAAAQARPRRRPARAARSPQVAERHLRRLGQGRRRQVDADRQPRRRAGRRGQDASACSTPTSGATRSRACSASAAQRPTVSAERKILPLEAARHQGHVDRLLRRGGRGGRLARADAPQGAHASSSRTSTGASSTTCSSTCRRAPATSR